MLFEGRQAYIVLDESADTHAATIEACGNIVQECVGVSRGSFADVIIENGVKYKFDEGSKSYLKEGI